jgi:hypothetical protein
MNSANKTPLLLGRGDGPEHVRYYFFHVVRLRFRLRLELKLRLSLCLYRYNV